MLPLRNKNSNQNLDREHRHRGKQEKQAESRQGRSEKLHKTADLRNRNDIMKL